MMRKCVFFVLFFELFCFSSVVVSQDTPREITKVVFFLNGALEHAWAFRNELGRQGVATTLSDQVLTSVVTTNEWDPNTTIPIVEKFIENGYKIVFFTSTGFGRTTAPGVAKRFPDVLFIQMPAVVLNPELTNLIEVDGLLYQPSYLAGILGGHMTETNKVGFLTGPLSNINAKAINSYCLGTHLVNPDVECYAIVMPSFTDPRMHKQGTEQLLAMGVDNVMGYTGNVIPSTMVAARFDQGESVYSAGWTDDFRAKIGPSVLTSSMFNFADLYADIVARYLAGEGDLIDRRIFASLSNLKSVDTAPPSEIVDAEILALFFSERDRLLAAPIGEEIIFCGEEATAGFPQDELDPNSCAPITGDMGYFLDYVDEIDGEFYFEDVYVKSDSGVYIALMVIVTLCVVLSFVYFFLFLYFVTTPIIRIASPVFCGIIFLGGWMQLAAAYTYLQKPTDATCMVPVWLEMVGFVMMLSAIVVKNYRLWKMFKTTHKFFPSSIPIVQLCGAVAVGLLGMLIILIAWQAADPYQATRETSDDLEVDEQYLYCGDTNEALWIGLVWGYLCVWILAGIFLAYLTRRLHGFFCETTEISLSLYNVAILELIFLPLIYTMDLDQYKGRTILLCIQAMYRAIGTLSFIFIPKFYVAIFCEDANTTEGMRSIKTSGGGSRQGTDVDA